MLKHSSSPGTSTVETSPRVAAVAAVVDGQDIFSGSMSSLNECICQTRRSRTPFLHMSGGALSDDPPLRRGDSTVQKRSGRRRVWWAGDSEGKECWINDRRQMKLEVVTPCCPTDWWRPAAATGSCCYATDWWRSVLPLLATGSSLCCLLLCYCDCDWWRPAAASGSPLHSVSALLPSTDSGGPQLPLPLLLALHSTLLLPYSLLTGGALLPLLLALHCCPTLWTGGALSCRYCAAASADAESLQLPQLKL